MDQKQVTHQAEEPFLNNTNPHWIPSLSIQSEEHSSGSVLYEDEHFALSTDGLSDFSNSDVSLPEVCTASKTKDSEEEVNPEVQQAFRIFSDFLTEKNKAITSQFLHPIENLENQSGTGGVCSRRQDNVKQTMCFSRMEEKFTNKEYDTITEFVADFRQMLENCYRFHGVDHWLSKQAQKLEIMLEQKLILLSRKLREKTTLAVTSNGRFAAGEERTSTVSTRRRQASRSLKTLSVGGHESIMVQTLRVEEQQKVKEEKRLRELEKKEAEAMSAKEMDEWEKSLLSQASPHDVETLWELPAIGHFLCLAQTALNLPEIVFFELERCLLMPRCSSLLSKIMSSLLSQPLRRSALHRRPGMPYRRWEAELRQRVLTWYQSIGAAQDQAAQAEKLGLCHQFFSVLGETSPLEAKAFHMLSFYQRVWLLKGLCDHVYETQRDIQDAVLAQPIHECRESILGYDSKENAYIHFPHFCGADLRIYCQSPSAPPTVPFTSVLVKRIKKSHKLEEDIASETIKDSGDKSFKAEMYVKSKRESNDEDEMIGRDPSCRPRNQKVHSDTVQITAPFKKRILMTEMEETELKSKRLKEDKETDRSLCIKNEIQEHCLSIGEHCYTGRSPAGSETSCIKSKINSDELKHYQCCHESSEISTYLPSENTHTFNEEREKDTILTTKEEHSKNKKRGKQLQRRSFQPEASKSSAPNRSTTIKRKEEKKKNIQGKAFNHVKRKKDQKEPSFKLVCANLDELRGLINKTEDELDDLASTKKRQNRWHNRRGAVKELHSTLVRLLNELTPWEPKLLKAYQRNRLRLKKEFEVFKSHPEYHNFVREDCVSSSASSSSDDGDVDHFRQSGPEDPEHILPRGLGGAVTEFSTEVTTERPVTHISFNHKQSRSTTNDRLSDHSDDSRNTCKYEVNPGLSNSPSLQLQTSLSKPNSLNVASGKPKSYTPIPTLLAKNVGNKVTLMKQPACPLEIDKLNLESKRTVVTTENTDQEKVNGCSSDSSHNAQQSSLKPLMDNAALPLPVSSISKTAELLKETTQVISTAHKSQYPALSCEEMRPQQVVILPSNIILNKSSEAPFLQQANGIYAVKPKDILKCHSNSILCMSTNLPGVLIPENKILIQQEPSPKTDTRSSFCDFPNFPKLQQSAINVARPQTSFSQSTPNYSSISPKPSVLLMSTDSKQELKTVCIRESQSILVTTRGGNTGIVKVQKPSDHLACLSKSPVITNAHQFHSYPIPKTAPGLSSDASGSVQTQSLIPSLKSNTKVTTCAKTSSISFSRELSSSPIRSQAISGLSGTNVNNPVTPESCPSAWVKTNIPSFTFPDTVSKPCSNEDKQSQREKLIFSSHGVSVCCTRTRPSSVTLTSFPAVKASLPTQGSSATLKQTTSTGTAQEVRKTLVSHTFNPVSLLKDKAEFASSETFPDTSVQVPCLIATTVAQNTAVQPQSSKCSESEQTMSITAQSAFTNSSVISRGTSDPASSLNTSNLDLSSISKIYQPRNITCPLPATNFQKNHGLSTIMISGNSNVYPATPQNVSKPLLTPSTQSKSLNSLLISNSSGNSLSFSKPQVPFAVPKLNDMDFSTKPTSNTTVTGPVQQQMVINTSLPLPGGAHIVLNNAKFTVPPKGLGPGSYVFLISGNAPQHLPFTSSKEGNVPVQEVKQAPVLQPFLSPKTAEKCPVLQRTSLERTTERASTQASTLVTSQHPTINISSISCSSSTALMHMGHSTLSVQKQEPTVVQPVLNSSMIKVEPAASENNPCEITAQPQPFWKSTTFSPVVFSPPSMEKHLLQSSALRIQSSTASKLHKSPEGAVLGKSTKEELDF